MTTDTSVVTTHEDGSESVKNTKNSLTTPDTGRIVPFGATPTVMKYMSDVAASSKVSDLTIEVVSKPSANLGSSSDEEQNRAPTPSPASCDDLPALWTEQHVAPANTSESSVNHLSKSQGVVEIDAETTQPALETNKKELSRIKSVLNIKKSLRAMRKSIKPLKETNPELYRASDVLRRAIKRELRFTRPIEAIRNIDELSSHFSKTLHALETSNQDDLSRHLDELIRLSNKQAARHDAPIVSTYVAFSLIQCIRILLICIINVPVRAYYALATLINESSPCNALKVLFRREDSPLERDRNDGIKNTAKLAQKIVYRPSKLIHKLRKREANLAEKAAYFKSTVEVMKANPGFFDYVSAENVSFTSSPKSLMAEWESVLDSNDDFFNPLGSTLGLSS